MIYKREREIKSLKNKFTIIIKSLIKSYLSSHMTMIITSNDDDDKFVDAMR